MANATVAQAGQASLAELQAVVTKHISHGLVKLRSFPIGHVNPCRRLQPIGQ
jgi:hypothetical protein